MSKRSTNENNYPFYWLDELVEVSLNPEKHDPANIKPAELQQIRQRLPYEFSRITTDLKNQAFSLYCADHVKVVAGHYDQALRILQKQAAANLRRYPKSGLLRQTGERIIEGLNELSQCLYNRYPSYLPEPAPPSEEEPGWSPVLLRKVLCALSADQAGIILRAATDAGILIGRSFRKVCKAIAPYLSTPWKEDILAETMRSHATRPEARDKEVAIAFLEKMIDKIRGYR